MKVIFLDFNGVLDTWENMDEINNDNLQRLKYIVDETKAKIVISSSLKNSYYYTGHLGKKLLDIINTLEKEDIRVIGITPLAKNREEEIQLYLESHQEIENFCIIDDDYEMPSFKNNIIKLPLQSEINSNGLDEQHMHMAIEILNHHKKKLIKV